MKLVSNPELATKLTMSIMNEGKRIVLKIVAN
jgi:hypothetical protein